MTLNQTIIMKYYLLIFTLILLYTTNGQINSIPKNIFFPKSDFSDTSNYERGIHSLSDNVIKFYSNADRVGYFNDMFRFYFAKNDYSATIQSLDSFATLAVPEKELKNIPGFHYRVHCLAMLATQNKSVTSYESAYKNKFNELYLALPEDGKDQVNNIYTKANPLEEKKKFIELTNKYLSGNDSITFSDAINFVKQWNYWQVYIKTVSLAEKQISAFKAFELANKESKLLGLDEGAVINPGTKTYITHVNLVDVENQKIMPNVTVGITGNSISSITSKLKTNLPAEATIIDGRGKYLMPGLTDAHIHFFQSGGLYTRPDGIDLRKYMPYEKEIEWNRLNMKDVL